MVAKAERSRTNNIITKMYAIELLGGGVESQNFEQYFRGNVQNYFNTILFGLAKIQQHHCSTLGESAFSGHDDCRVRLLAVSS